MAQSPPDELRNTTGVMTMMLMFGGAVGLLARRATHTWTGAGVFVWWGTSLAIVPLARAFLRAQCARKSWWGHPVVVLGAGEGRPHARARTARPTSGFRSSPGHGAGRRSHPARDPSRSAEQRSGRHRGPFRDPGNRSPGNPVAPRCDFASARIRDCCRVRTHPPDADPARHSRAPSEPAPGPASLGSHSRLLGVARPRGTFAEIDGVPVVGDFAWPPSSRSACTSRTPCWPCPKQVRTTSSSSSSVSVARSRTCSSSPISLASRVSVSPRRT